MDNDCKTLYKSNTTGATSWAGTVYPFRSTWIHYVKCVVDHCLPFSVWTWYYLSFFDLRLLITPLVSSNFLFRNTPQSPCF